MEAVNLGNSGNQVALHTSKGCEMNRRRLMTGKQLDKQCASSSEDNDGCAVQGQPATFGAEFNKNGGGVRLTLSFAHLL